jgi:hypothetical protein
VTYAFSKLDVEHKLFNELLEQKPVWWQNIVKSVKNKKIYVDVRKDNYINVYSNGGSLLKLYYSKGFKGEIHFEYVPIESRKTYIPFAFKDNYIELETSKVGLGFAGTDNFSDKGIENLQNRIEKFFPPSSEKGIQADFVLKNSAFLDTEFQYNSEDKSKRIRFDLVWVDEKSHKLYVVELKTISDPRLYYNGNNLDSSSDDKIDAQLKKYRGFIRKHSHDLLSHYGRVLSIKRKLEVLPEGFPQLNSLDGFMFEERPILLIGDCTQVWIDANKCRLKDSIQDIAYGCFYQGKNTRLFYIPRRTTGNRHVFINCA